MRRYLYPQNLKATANLWLWSLRDFLILGVAALLSVIALVELHLALPGALTLCYAFLSMRLDDYTIMDFILQAGRFLILSQQYFEWR